MSLHDKIDTWTRPLMRAQRVLYEFGEEFETGSRAKALQLLHAHLRHIRQLIRFLQENPKEGRKP